MNIEIKPGVYIKFIDDTVLTVFNVVSKAFRLNGEVCVLTSAADGEHGKDSYHKSGHAWDFRAVRDPVYHHIYWSLRFALSQIDSCYDTVFEKEKGNEHFHIEYDLRRAEKLRLDKTGLDIDNPKLKEEIKMAKSATYKWILNVAAVLLSGIIKMVTEKFRDEITAYVKEKYAAALETDNPWDDMFFEFMAKMLDIKI